jgi:hypothetical protein
MTEMAIVFVTAATVVFGLNWWEKQRRPRRSPRQLPPKQDESA